MGKRPARSPSKRHFGVPLDLAPMEARLTERLPDEGGWQYEPKWDGFRCLAFKAGPDVELRAKSGKPLGRYFPEIITMLGELPSGQFVVDGELVIEIDGRLSFDALQMRLHPAESRIQKLSRQTPARFILFDILLTPSGDTVIDQPLSVRSIRQRSTRNMTLVRQATAQAVKRPMQFGRLKPSHKFRLRRRAGKSDKAVIA